MASARILSPPRVLAYSAILVRRATRHKAPTARTTAQPHLPHARRPCSRAPKRSYAPLRSHSADTALRSFERHAAQKLHPAEYALAHLERRMSYISLGHVRDLAEAPKRRRREARGRSRRRRADRGRG